LHSKLQYGVIAFILRLIRAGASLDDPEVPTTSTMSNTQAELWIINNSAQWNDKCSSTFKGVCAIGFIDIVNDVENTYVGVMERVMKAFSTTEMKRGAVNFLLVDGRCYQSFGSQFDVQPPKLPTVVAYAPSKQRFALFKGSYSEVSN
jgi:hypothetical protein